MPKNKTQTTNESVIHFLDAIEDDTKRNDSYVLVDLFKNITGFEPKMFGPTIIGFGNYHYRYASGHEGDAPIAAFAPRKTELVFYLSPEFELREQLLEKLGKHKASKGCVYVKRLSDVDMKVISDLITYSTARIKEQYPDR